MKTGETRGPFWELWRFNAQWRVDRVHVTSSMGMGEYSVVLANGWSVDYLFSGRTRAEALLRFRIEHPGEKVYEMKPGLDNSFRSRKELAQGFEEVPE